MIGQEQWGEYVITASEFLEKVEEIAAENPVYRNGGTGTDGTCDCIGLIMGAMYRCGRKKYPLHGSNYFARRETVELEQVDAWAKGMIVYKAKEPSESGYRLPERYQPDGTYYNGDLLDYYHVGVVTGVCPFEITHCTGSGNVNGIKRDSTEREYRDWKLGGFVNGVDYGWTEKGEEENRMETVGIVKSPDGMPVKLRRDPSTKNPYIGKVPVGEEVTVHENAGDWLSVTWNGKRGYMMKRFVEMEEPMKPEEPAAALTPESVYNMDDIYELLSKILEALVKNPYGEEDNG